MCRYYVQDHSFHAVRPPNVHVLLYLYIHYVQYVHTSVQYRICYVSSCVKAVSAAGCSNSSRLLCAFEAMDPRTEDVGRLCECRAFWLIIISRAWGWISWWLWILN
jgi:hypothetical protein